MTTQLQWRPVNDWTIRTSCDRYEIKRALNYDAHPALSYAYAPKCIADPTRVIGEGRYPDSKLARAACQTDFDLQQQSTNITKG